MNIKQKRKALVRSHRKKMQELKKQKPEMRITKKRKRLLLIEGFLADLIDAGVGVFVVIGDIVSTFGIYKYFTWRFKQYNVEADEFLDNGLGGKFGKITTWILDTISGFVPVIGDMVDLVFASWIVTVYTTTKEIREIDKEKINKHKERVKKERVLFQQKMRRLQSLQLSNHG